MSELIEVTVIDAEGRTTVARMRLEQALALREQLARLLSEAQGRPPIIPFSLTPLGRARESDRVSPPEAVDGA